MLKAQVPCYYCFTKNEIQVGSQFYNIDAFYTCYSCGSTVSVSIRQKAIEAPYEVQTGKPIVSGFRPELIICDDVEEDT